MPISTEEHAKSAEFIATLRNMMEIVDKISDKIPEGDYLELMKGLKTSYDYKDAKTLTQIVRQVIYRDPIVQHHERRATYKVSDRTKEKDEAEDLRTGISVVCPCCDVVVRKKGLAEHQATRKCKKASQSKMLTKTTKKAKTDRETRIITHINAFRLRRADNARVFSTKIQYLKRQKELGFSDEYALRIYGNYLATKRRDFNPNRAEQPSPALRRMLFDAIAWVIKEHDQVNP